MTDAAAALGIPQSSMSRRVHALEATLGVPLLIRDGRVVRLTPEAVAIVERVRGPLREIDAALDLVTEAADPDHGTVRFGFPLTMGAGPVPEMLGDFHRQHPGIRLELKQAHGSALGAELRAGTLDLAVVIPPPNDLPHTVLAAQEICVVLPDTHPLAARRSLRLAELQDETFIAGPPDYHLRQATDAWCHDAGFEPNVAVEITELATIRGLIRRGLGIALLPRDLEPAAGTVDVAIADQEATREIALAWPDGSQSPVAQRLAQFIFDWLRRAMP